MIENSQNVSIGKIAKLFGVTVQTIRRWEKLGKLNSFRTIGNHRRFNKNIVQNQHDRVNICYARVSSNDQITHKDRILRFGAEIIFNIAEKFGTKIVILNQKESSFEQKLAENVLEIITVFSAKLYGKRSHKNKLLNA